MFQTHGIHALIPGELAEYRTLIVDLLGTFVRALPAARQSEIAATMFSLPPDASAALRVTTLMSICPTLHKLGQVLARDHRFSPDFRQRLHVLESADSDLPAAGVVEQIRRELGEVAPGTLRIDQRILAEASVAHVVPFAWDDRGRTVAGVFKVLKPGIERKLDEELLAWAHIADELDRHSAAGRIPDAEFRATLDEVARLLREEVRLDHEQRHLAAAARRLPPTARVFVPELLPFCSPRITAMTRVAGMRITDSPAGVIGRHAMAGHLVDALLAGPLFSADDVAVFHGDPHAGNLLATPDERVAVLDWSLVGTLDRPTRGAMVQIVLGALLFDVPRIARAVAALAELPPSEAPLRGEIDRALARLWPGVPPTIDWLMSLLDDLVLRAAVRFPSNLLLFRKALGMLRDVTRDLAPACRIELVLAAALARQLALEWPRRFVLGPLAGGFDSHISTPDLLTCLAQAPLAPLRRYVRS
ncbi:MAG: protein kinase UbiB [Phycisphaerae bacterium]|nr:protein kinase UbiB [Phycisphaerae bacterium]